MEVIEVSTHVAFIKVNAVSLSKHSIPKNTVLHIYPSDRIRDDQNALVHALLPGTATKPEVTHKFYESWLHLLEHTTLTVEGLEDEEEIIEVYGYEDTVPSMTEADVEPDGHDQYGFPSVLLATGNI